MNKIDGKSISLKVLAAYARDIGQGVARIDHTSMDSPGASSGDIVEIIGEKGGIDAKCYLLLPSDEGQGITRMDPEIRQVVGVEMDDIVTLRRTTVVPAENSVLAEGDLIKEEHNQDSSLEPSAHTTPLQERPATEEREEASERMNKISATAISAMITFSGSSLDFEKERTKIIEFTSMLETATHTKSECKCYTDGKKALGWTFFRLEIGRALADKLIDLYPDIKKQEAGTPEGRLALWVNKQLKKMKIDSHLKLSDVPQEQVKGFRLNPEYYRDKMDTEDLR